jgi:hypothetical protein
LYLRMRRSSQGGSCEDVVSAYCTAKVTSAGCTPLLTCKGTPMKNSNSGFDLYAFGLRPNKFGLFFYSTAFGAQNTPFQGGWLCMKPPIKRLSIQNSGSSGAPCGTDPATGVMTRDFNTFMSTSSDPTLTVGTPVQIQAWTRDPQASFGTSLTGALVGTIFP